MWGDAKFRALSAPQPNGQTLWVYLLTGPHTTSIPGVIVAGEAGLAEAIGWPLKGFREGFAEVFRQGLVEADFEARVLWIPKAILYNPPANPNVVKSWQPYWDEVPECALKSKIFIALKGFLEGLGEGFAKGFREGLAKPFGESGAGAGTGTGTGIPPNPPKGGTESSKPKFLPEAALIPEPLDTPAFRLAWAEWCADRKDRRKPITEKGAAGQLRKLAAMGCAKAIESIEASIAAGWAGLFEPQRNGASKPGIAERAVASAQEFLRMGEPQ